MTGNHDDYDKRHYYMTVFHAFIIIIVFCCYCFYFRFIIMAFILIFIQADREMIYMSVDYGLMVFVTYSDTCILHFFKIRRTLENIAN